MTQQLFKVSTPCIDDRHFKVEEMKSIGELSHVCSQIVLKCLYLARIGRPDILWLVNKLARSITKWTKACDKRLNRLISQIPQTCENKQFCHVGGVAKQCRLGLFQDSDFAVANHTFVPISWMCKKQTAFSCNSTKSEIISLDTGLRMDGLPFLELWDLIVSIFAYVSHVSDPSGQPDNDRHKPYKKIDVMKDIDSIPSNVQSSHQEASLYVFEENEAVIKMTIKGRSPTMRHVSRTHRVAGIFKDVRFYPILNFGLFLGPLIFSMFLPHNEFWPLGRPLKDVLEFFQIFGPAPSPHTVSIVSCVFLCVLLPCSLAIFSLSEVFGCLGFRFLGV